MQNSRIDSSKPTSAVATSKYATRYYWETRRAKFIKSAEKRLQSETVKNVMKYMHGHYWRNRVAELIRSIRKRIQSEAVANASWCEEGVVSRVIPNSLPSQIDNEAHPSDVHNWVLLVDYRIPMPENNSASLRMFHIMKIILEAGYKVFIVSTHTLDQYKWVVSSRSELFPFENRLRQLG